MKLWIVGKSPEHDAVDTRWEFCGVFDAESKAVAACTTDHHFTGPANLNEVLPEREDWPGAYYPLFTPRVIETDVKE